jgi:hypothetical protein
MKDNKKIAGPSAIEALRQTGSIAKAAKVLGIPRTTTYSRVVNEIVAGGTSVPVLDIVEEHALRLQNKQLKRERDDAVARALEETQRNEYVETLAGVKLDPPEWLIQKPKGRTHHGIITAFFSDPHFDEVVRASEMNGVNAYNRQIANLRLQEFFQGAIKLTRDYIAGIKIDGLVLPLGGDMVSGNIHEELERTNEAPILDTCVYWSEQLAAGIEMLAKFFPKVHIPCVTGNHGRLRKKPQYKQRARDNYDWLIYQILKKEFRHNERITFDIPDGSDCRYNVYTTRMLLTHGDQFSGGNGIGGIAVPIMRGDAKKQKRESALGRSYDYMLIGHWHQRRNLGSVLINGSLKGYDEFAAGNNFDFEPPQQSMWVTTPERGVTIETPIMVQSKQEKW